MHDDLRQLELDATERLESYAATTVEVLNAHLSAMGFTWDPPGPFFTHEATGVTVTFGTGGYRVTWPLITGHGMASAEFAMSGSPRLPCDLAQHLVWACTYRNERERERDA